MTVFVICLAVFVILVATLELISLYKNHYKTVQNAVNYDPEWRTFVYKIRMTEKEIIGELSTKNQLDELSFEFELEFGKHIVKISDGGATFKFSYEIQERDDDSLLRLTVIPTVHARSNLMWKLNPAMIEKLNAEIIPFEQWHYPSTP